LLMRKALATASCLVIRLQRRRLGLDTTAKGRRSEGGATAKNVGSPVRSPRMTKRKKSGGADWAARAAAMAAAIAARKRTTMWLELRTTTRSMFQRERVDAFDFVALQVGEQTFVREIHRMGILPVLMHDFLEAIEDVLVMHLDGQLAAAVETAGR